MPDHDAEFFSRQGDGEINFAAPMGSGFARGQPLTEIGPGPFKKHPVVSADGSRLYWADSRTAPSSVLAIWMARRGPDGPADFQSPQLVEGGDLADAFDYPSWESEDGCELYFTSRRNDDDEIWVGRRLTR